MESAEREDLGRISRELLSFAHQTLTRYGAFLPFAAVVDDGGDLKLVAAQSEDPDASGLIDDLYERLAAEAVDGTVRAAGICYEVTLADPVDNGHEAVAIDLEHAAGAAMRCLVPYRREPGGWAFGTAEATPAAPRVFAPERP